MRLRSVLLGLMLALLLAACDSEPAPGPSPGATPTITGTAAAAPTTVPEVMPPLDETPTPAEQPPPGVPSIEVAPTDTSAGSTPTPAVSPAGPTFTPASSLAGPTPTPASQISCEPTRADAEGPFYVPNAPERTSVGEGHMLRGVVRSSRDCSSIAGARLEFWQVGPDALYDDAHRATLFSQASGEYSFESNFPPGYEGRPPHIHIRATAPGHQVLVTQFYPQQGQTEAPFDIVLVPDGR